MDTFELFPSRTRLVIATGFGIALLIAGRWLWGVFGAQSGGPSLAWAWPALCLFLGATILLRALRSLLRPGPCFCGDSKGFSVMGKPKRPWAEFETVSVTRFSVNFIPSAHWVSVKLRRKGRGRAGSQDIPWTHLPASANETAKAIAQLAELARNHQPTPPPTYDPYDPAALRQARSRAA